MNEEIPNSYKAASEYHTTNVVSYGDVKLWVSVIGKGVMIDQLAYLKRPVIYIKTLMSLKTVLH